MKMQPRVDLAIILLNWNAADETCHLLRRLITWTHLQPRIYIVDNGSADNSVEVISAEFPDVEFIRNEKNEGFSGGNNAALRTIIDSPSNGSTFNSSQFLLLLNNDAFIEEKDLLVLIESLNADPQVGVIGPLLYDGSDFKKLLSAGGLDPSQNGRTYWAGDDAEDYIERTGKPYEVDYVSGTVALLRNSVVRETGIFDENYFFSCEMADLCERLKGNGYKCTINPVARAWHDVHSSPKNRDTLYIYYSLRNRFLFIRKFRQEKKIRLFCYWMMIGGKGMVKALLLGRLATVRALFLALRDGLAGRYGGRNELFLDKPND